MLSLVPGSLSTRKGRYHCNFGGSLGWKTTRSDLEVDRHRLPLNITINTVLKIDGDNRAVFLLSLTIRLAARNGYGSIAHEAHEAKPNGLLTSGP